MHVGNQQIWKDLEQKRSDLKETTALFSKRLGLNSVSYRKNRSRLTVTAGMVPVVKKLLGVTEMEIFSSAIPKDEKTSINNDLHCRS
jgi:hypothetical protein